ncbi:MAG: TolC family protein [Candidatus Omnitrophota bacterium]
MKNILTIISLVFNFFIFSSISYAQEVPCQESDQCRELMLDEFIALACQNDPFFERLLIDEYMLNYYPAINLDPRDFILSVTDEHSLTLRKNELDADATVSLSKLFRKTGTTVSAEYSLSSTDDESSASLLLSQDIASNAFGRAGRLKEKIAGVEVELSCYQLIEAYEDYLAGLLKLYYDWYEAYEKMKTAQVSYEKNIDLLENIKERKRNRIALEIDVNKISVQVLDKKAKLIGFTVDYNVFLNEVLRAVGQKNTFCFTPGPVSTQTLDFEPFENLYGVFKSSGRTSKILSFLEDKGVFEKNLRADELLPSIALTAEYKTEGSGYEIEHSQNSAILGLRFGWPFPGERKKARFETAKLSLERTKLSSALTNLQLYSDLSSLYEKINNEKQLIELARQKIDLAGEIVKDETENYSYGKVSLNDLIQEVNSLEDKKLEGIFHTIRFKKMLLEWFRLTDSLVSGSNIKSITIENNQKEPQVSSSKPQD